MLGLRQLDEQQSHPADDGFYGRRANLHLPPPAYNPLANVSPPLTPAYERTDELFPASSSAEPSPSSDIWPDDDSLTSIERIYLYSRSKLPAHRAYIARNFATHLQDVDPDEAVDYVLPLLTELAIDEEASVQEALASELPPTLLWFFSECEMVDFSEETIQAIEPTAQEDEPNSASLSQSAVSIQVVAALLATLLVSLRLNVAAAARRSVIDLLEQLSDTSRHSLPSIPLRLKRMVHQELILQVVIGVGKLDFYNPPAIESSLDLQGEIDDEALESADPYRPTPGEHSLAAQALSSSHDTGIETESFPPVQPPSSASEISDLDDSSISGFHPEEVKLGRFSAMSMIATITGNDRGRLPPSNISLFLAEIRRIAEDHAHWIRSEAALAMGALSKVIPEELLYTILLPLHQTFVEDQHWRVRHSSLLALPNFLTRLPLDRRKKLAVSTLDHLSRDPNEEVRSGVLEVLGETIYKFAPNSIDPLSSPPIELVNMFLGSEEEAPKVTKALPSVEPNVAPPLSSSGSLRSLFERKTDNYARFTSAQQVNPVSQKDLICAYNYPAVVLTLGAHCWKGRLREYYLKLWSCESHNIQHTLAASLADIAEMIGPENTRKDLLQCWKTALFNDDSQIRQMSVQHFRPLYSTLPPADRDQIVATLVSAWKGRLSGWRERLVVAELLPVMSERDEEDFVPFVGQVLRDPVAAVRLKVVELIPGILQSISSRGCSTLKLLEDIKSLATSTRHQLRSTFLECLRVLAIDCPEGDLDVDLQPWIVSLEALSRDIVSGVRIGVARLASRLHDKLHHSLTPRPPLLDEILAALQEDSVGEVRAYIAPSLVSFHVPTSEADITKAELLGTPEMKFSIPPPPSRPSSDERGTSDNENGEGFPHERRRSPSDTASPHENPPPLENLPVLEALGIGTESAPLPTIPSDLPQVQPGGLSPEPAHSSLRERTNAASESESTQKSKGINQSPGPTAFTLSFDDQHTHHSHDLIQFSPTFIEMPAVKAITPAAFGSLSGAPSPAVAFLPTPLKPLAYSVHTEAYDTKPSPNLSTGPSNPAPHSITSSGFVQDESPKTAGGGLDYFSLSFASVASAPDLIPVGSNEDADAIATARSPTSPLKLDAPDHLQGLSR